MTGRVSVNGGDPTLKLEGLDIALKGRSAAVARRQGDGSELTIGIRPEHFELASADMSKDSTVTVPAAVDVVEFLGNDELIHTTLAGADVVAIVRADRHLKVGDKVELAVPEDLVHAFDPHSDATLTGTAAPA
jgi:ABC-type sugar transport system ATPase subunit